MATHATTTSTPGLTSERVKAISTLAVTLVTATNAALSLSGHNPLPFSETDAYTAVSGALAFAATLYAWWRNQNLTPAAAQGSALTKAIKANATTQATTLPPQVTDSLDVENVKNVEVSQTTSEQLTAAFDRVTQEQKDA